MDKPYIQDKEFQQPDLPLKPGEYENCVFSGCDLSNTDLSGFQFTACTFNDCNLSMAKLMKTTFTDARFRNCKMMGLRFEQCNSFLFTATFENCVLNLSSFFKLKLKKMRFSNCTLHEVDYTEADLSGAVFHGSDLTRAVFENTDLSKADLSQAFHYSIDPEKNKLKKARFAAHGLIGLLGKYDIEVRG